MALNIHVFVRDEAGDLQWMDWQEYPHNAMFGSEPHRTSVWSSPLLTGAGLQIIPSLSYMNLMIEHDELTDLEHETTTLLEYADALSTRLEIEPHEFRFYLENLQFAIQKAKDFSSSYPSAGVHIA